MEKVKSVLENSIEEPLEAIEEKKKADTSMNLAKIDYDAEMSVASSIGSPLPAKNDLSRSHDKIKQMIPILDFSKIKGRLDLKKMPDDILAQLDKKKPIGTNT